ARPSVALRLFQARPGTGLPRRCLEQPGRQVAIAGVRDDVLADQLTHHLRGRLILRGADLLEHPLLARVKEHRESGGLVLHAGVSPEGTPDGMLTTLSLQHHLTRMPGTAPASGDTR